MVRIGLCGAGGTGKGTLAKAFNERHPEVKIIPSTVQHVGQIIAPASENYKEIPSAFKPYFQDAILAVQAETERTMTANGLDFISERSLADFVPYMDRVLKEIYGRVNKKDHQNYVNRMMTYLKETPYTHIFFLPSDDFEPEDTEDSSWKERDPLERIRTNDSLREILAGIGEDLGIPVRILKGTVEERLEKMEEAVYGKEETNSVTHG